MNIRNNSGRSALVASVDGSRPSIERTEGENIMVARMYLEKRGFVVTRSLVTIAEVANFLGCSRPTVLRLRNEPDFPAAFDIMSGRSNITAQRSTPRWRMSDIVDWLEGRKVVDSSNDQ